MQSPDTPIAIFNREGKQTGTKPRSHINKHKDILKTINIIITNQKEEIFMIKAKDSAWPNKWGGSCATLLKDKESIEQAAERVLERELSLKEKPRFVSEKFQDFNGIHRIQTVFHLTTETKLKPNTSDFHEHKWVLLQEARQLIEKSACMPTFEAAFRELKATFK